MSNLRHFLGRNSQRILNRLGYGIVRLDRVRTTMEAALKAIARRGIPVGGVIDVGASNGSWSEILMHDYPTSRYLLVEAQKVHEEGLKAFCEAHANARYALVAAGGEDGTINFDATSPVAGQASHVAYRSNNEVVPMSRIDTLVETHRLPGPFLLKLDTHGFEVPILEGARETLKKTNAIVMECYNFRIAPECLLFHEMCGYLEKLGFRCIDLVETLHRPLDDSFWQADLVFVRQDRPEFGDLRYSAGPEPA